MISPSSAPDDEIGAVENTGSAWAIRDCARYRAAEALRRAARCAQPSKFAASVVVSMSQLPIGSPLELTQKPVAAPTAEFRSLRGFAAEGLFCRRRSFAVRRTISRPLEFPVGVFV